MGRLSVNERSDGGLVSVVAYHDFMLDIAQRLQLVDTVVVISNALAG